MVEGDGVGRVASALRRNGLIAGADNGEDLEIEGNWTKRQETALQESLSKIKPGVNFWRLVAERVPGKNANDCSQKFYSGRTATRAAKRFCVLGELEFALTERSGNKGVKSFESNAPTNCKTPGRETRASRQSATGPAIKQSNASGEGYDVALTERNGSKRVKSFESNAPTNCKTPGRETRAARQNATGIATKQSNMSGEGYDVALTERSGSKRAKSVESNAPTHWKTPGRETRAARQAVTGTATKQSKTSGDGYDVALTERNGSKRVKSFESNAPTSCKTPGRETRAARQAATGPATTQKTMSGKGNDAAVTERSGSKRVKSLESNSPLNFKTPGRETRASRQAAMGPDKTKSKMSGFNAGPLQTVATGSRGTKRRIETASNLPDVKRIKATKPESKANGGTLGQRARKDRKVLIENIEASGFGQSSDSDDGDDSDSAFRVSEDGDLWTQEQEMALQNAYTTIKPSANFWHLISKRVPGRSAEECFNKFYSAHPTPPRVPRRSGLKEVDCPPPLLPRLTKAKATRGKRLLEAHRTVRSILRKQQLDHEDYKADAFAALEPPDVVHSVFAMSKDTEVKLCANNGFLPKGTETSTPQYPQADKENWKAKPVGLSSELGIGQSGVFSPEILKKVKNPLLLDKYIDHLHQRRTRTVGTKSAQRRESARRARGVCDLFKEGLDFREVRLNAIHRAKQELRDVFLRPSSAVDDPFLNLLDESSDDSGQDDEEDDVSVDT